MNALMGPNMCQVFKTLKNIYSNNSRFPCRVKERSYNALLCQHFRESRHIVILILTDFYHTLRRRDYFKIYQQMAKVSYQTTERLKKGRNY